MAYEPSGMRDSRHVGQSGPYVDVFVQPPVMHAAVTRFSCVALNTIMSAVVSLSQCADQTMHGLTSLDLQLQDLARFGLSAMQNGGKFTVSWT